MAIKTLRYQDQPGSNQKATKDSIVVGRPPQSAANDPTPSCLDGMGSATAKIIINRRLSEKFLQECGVKEVKNTGRYYSAQIISKNGKIIDEVLVDKQCGSIISLHKRIE